MNFSFSFSNVKICFFILSYNYQWKNLCPSISDTTAHLIWFETWQVCCRGPKGSTASSVTLFGCCCRFICRLDQSKSSDWTKTRHIFNGLMCYRCYSKWNNLLTEGRTRCDMLRLHSGVWDILWTKQLIYWWRKQYADKESLIAVTKTGLNTLRDFFFYFILSLNWFFFQ